MRSFHSFRLESGLLVCLVEQSKASRTAGFAEVSREAALRAANEPFDENFFFAFESHDEGFQVGNLQLEVVEYRPASVFPVFKTNAKKNGKNKGMVFLLYGRQVGRLLRSAELQCVMTESTQLVGDRARHVGTAERRICCLI